MKTEFQSHFNLHALHNRCLIENSLFQQFGFVFCARNNQFLMLTDWRCDGGGELLGV